MKGKTAAELAAEHRRARSEEQLRANLKRRKDQMRARRAAGTPAADGSEVEDETPGDGDSDGKG